MVNLLSAKPRHLLRPNATQDQPARYEGFVLLAFLVLIRIEA
jgi:hypothetical protein